MAASQSDILDALLYFRLDYIGFRWNFNLAVDTSTSAPGGIGSAVALTFTFPTVLPAYDTGLTGFLALSAEQASAARLAFASYAAVGGLTFAETTQLGTSNIALIQHDFQSPSSAGVAGYAYAPSLGFSSNPATGIILSAGELLGTSPGNFQSGDVFLLAGYATGDYGIQGDGYQVLLHEIGHALGLKHPFDTPGTLAATENHKGFTVMAYNEAPHSLVVPVSVTAMGFSFSFAHVQPRTPMLGDVLAIQFTYGANHDYHIGNDSYGWQSGEKFLETLWDGAGTDTIDAGNQVLPSMIDLTPGSFSSIGLRQTHAELFSDIPAFAESTIISHLTANGLSDADLYSGRDNLAIAYGADIENALGGAGNDTLLGNLLGNLLDGGVGNDTLDGRGGDDSLAGGSGFDSLIGGLGNDTLRGGEQADTLLGGDGDDYINAGKGTDVANGGAGNDTLAGALGNDVLIGGDGVDTADYSGSTDGVVVSLALAVAQQVSVATGIDTLSLIENLTGSNFSDNLTGTTGNNTLIGLLGNDSLTGDAGFDLLDGGADNDSLSGGLNADTLLGGAGNDFVSGGQGTDNLNGGDGDDTLVGGLGTDLLTGGAGADRFVFKHVLDGANNIDTFTDFTSAVDLIELSASIFGAFAGQTGSTIGSNANLLYTPGTGVLAYDADGTGAGAPVTFAIVGTSSHPGTIGNDFLIVA